MEKLKQTLDQIEHLYMRLGRLKSKYESLCSMDEENVELLMSIPMLAGTVIIDRSYISDEFFTEKKREIHNEISQLKDKVGEIEQCLEDG